MSRQTAQTGSDCGQLQTEADAKLPRSRASQTNQKPVSQEREMESGARRKHRFCLTSGHPFCGRLDKRRALFFLQSFLAWGSAIGDRQWEGTNTFTSPGGATLRECHWFVVFRSIGALGTHPAAFAKKNSRAKSSQLHEGKCVRINAVPTGTRSQSKRQTTQTRPRLAASPSRHHPPDGY